MKIVLLTFALCLACVFGEQCYNTDSCVNQGLTSCKYPTHLECVNHNCYCVDGAVTTPGSQCKTYADCSLHCDGIFFIPFCDNAEFEVERASLSVKDFFIMPLSIMAWIEYALSVKALSVKALSVKAMSANVFSVKTFSVKVLSVNALSVKASSAKVLRVKGT
ncbi:hypothetical protein ACF0H5_022794 [Mactra antiquata]